MVLPAVLQEQLAEQMRQAGIPLPEGQGRWAQAEAAIIGVWASKFNDRAYFSMRKVGLNFMDLRMAVLVQRVVPADYAFVIHTVNPSTGACPAPQQHNASGSTGASRGAAVHATTGVVTSQP